MKKIILLLTLITTINFAANPFDSLHLNRTNSHLSLSKSNIPLSQKIIYAKRASARGNAQASFDLGIMYAQGMGVARDEHVAFNYFHKAARKNHIEAKFYMGLSFAQGRGVRRQPHLARYWFKLAAKAGHPKAMAHLASIERVLAPQYGQNSRVALNSFR